MNEIICSDCGKELGNQVALSWHREGVHGADRWKPTASPGQSRKARVSAGPRESVRAPEAHRAETSEVAPPEATVEDLKQEVRGWGIGLIVLGAAQYFLPFLDPMWAFFVVPLGVLSLLFSHRVMFIAIGVGLVVVGLSNVFGGGFGGWTIYGVAQIYWGAQEFGKFGKYADAR